MGEYREHIYTNPVDPNMDQFFAGTSNLVLPVRNKSFFPPEFREKSRLAYYASLLSSIEINASFYRMPLARTIVKWSNEVAGNFVFSFKLIKDVTHAKKGQFDLQPVPEFMKAISATTRRGCLLVQLPPKFGPDPLQLAALLAALKDHGWPVAIEFRHPGWYSEHVFDLLADFNAAIVLHDLPKSAAPMVITSGTHVYLRFHGPEGGYRGSYPDDYLYEYAGYIRDWLSGGKTVYCYFNNTLGAAMHNLLTLNRFLA